MLVQPVRSCPPASCLITKCGDGNKAFVLMLAAFLEHVHEKATFIHALEQNVRSVNAMMRPNACEKTSKLLFATTAKSFTSTWIAAF